MKRAWPLALSAAVAGVLSVPGARAASHAVAAELAQCTAISAPDARLACYDALAGRSPPHPAQSANNAAAVPTPAPAAVAAAPAPASASAATAPPVSPAPAEDPRNFGLPATRVDPAKHKSEVNQAIEAHVAQLKTNQLRSSYVVLDNGQTWICTEGDMNLNEGEAVTIKHAALGSFLLTSASHHSYHVRRVN